MHKADIKARAARRLAHRVKPLGLACEFQNCARTSLRVEAGVRRNPACYHFPHAHTLARRFHLTTRRGRLKHKSVRSAPRLFFHQLPTGLASCLFITCQKQHHGSFWNNV
jgi:hypothetical protein